MPTSIPRASSLLLLVAGALGGCATPLPLVRLSPNLPNVVWVSGRASVTREEGGVRVAIAFEHQDGATLGLHVEVQNTGTAQLDVDPHEFTFTPCGSMDPAMCDRTYRVIDPEQVLASLDERQSRERADAVNSQAVLGTLVILNAVGDVATIASGHANAHTGEGTMVAANAAESDADVRQSRLASIAAQESIWSNEAFRRTTLFPGQGAAGRVYIRIALNAPIVWVHVRTGGHDFSFPFQQTVTQLGPTASSAPQRRR